MRAKSSWNGGMAYHYQCENGGTGRIGARTDGTERPCKNVAARLWDVASMIWNLHLWGGSVRHCSDDRATVTKQDDDGLSEERRFVWLDIAGTTVKVRTSSFVGFTVTRQFFITISGSPSDSSSFQDHLFFYLNRTVDTVRSRFNQLNQPIRVEFYNIGSWLPIFGWKKI